MSIVINKSCLLAFNIVLNIKIMKKYILTAIFVCLCFITDNTQASLPEKGINYIKKADFRTAYAYILKHEGWYANVPGDRGKETYGGISRKYNPNWWGWRFIDEYKRNNGPIARYTHFPELDFWVMDYYLDIWVSEHFDLVIDQEIASYVLDFRINGTSSVCIIKRSIRDAGGNIELSHKMTKETIEIINKINKKKFLNSLKKRRKDYYKNIVKKDSSQIVFLKHWLLRSK